MKNWRLGWIWYSTSNKGQLSSYFWVTIPGLSYSPKFAEAWFQVVWQCNGLRSRPLCFNFLQSHNVWLQTLERERACVCVCLREREREVLSKNTNWNNLKRKRISWRFIFCMTLGRRGGGGTDGSFYNLVQNLMLKVKVIFDRIVKLMTEL